jgi:hypothetical protein
LKISKKYKWPEGSDFVHLRYCKIISYSPRVWNNENIFFSVEVFEKNSNRSTLIFLKKNIFFILIFSSLSTEIALSHVANFSLYPTSEIVAIFFLKSHF